MAGQTAVQRGPLAESNICSQDNKENGFLGTSISVQSDSMALPGGLGQPVLVGV